MEAMSTTVELVATLLMVVLPISLSVVATSFPEALLLVEILGQPIHRLLKMAGKPNLSCSSQQPFTASYV